MALKMSMEFSVLAGVILTLAILVTPTTGYAKDMQVIDRYDGGFDVKFPNGCSVRYDSYGNRGDSSGRCKKRQYERADEGVRAQLGSNDSGGGTWYSRLVGASSDGAKSQLDMNGFRQVDSFDSGRDGYGTIWFNDSTRQCLQVINVNRRVDSAVDIQTHPNCRPRGSHGNSGGEQWYSRLVGASSEGAKSQLDMNGFRQVDSFDSGRNGYGLIWFNDSSRQCLQVIIASGRVDSAVDINSHPRCRR